MMPPSEAPRAEGFGARAPSPGAWSSRSGPSGPYGSEQGPPVRKRAASEVVPDADAQDVEQRLGDMELHLAVFYSVLNHLHAQDADTRKKLADLKS